MMLGKRSRHNSVKRTTSLLQFTTVVDPPAAVDVHANPADQIGDAPHSQISETVVDPWSAAAAATTTIAEVVECPRALTAAAGEGGGAGAGGQFPFHHPMLHRRYSADFAQTLDTNTKDQIASHFLRDCSLCKRRLVPGRDIYMYRGDRAFCSSECRQQQITQDHRKEKLSSSSIPKKENNTAAALPPASPSSASPKDVFAIGEMVTSTAATATTMCN